MTDEFAGDASRQALWFAFLKKNELSAVPLQTVITALRADVQVAFKQAVAIAVEIAKQDSSKSSTPSISP